MRGQTRCTVPTMILAAAFSLASRPVIGGESSDCSVRVNTHYSADGSRRDVEQERCANGMLRTAERSYDAAGALVSVDAYEITANGAVKHVQSSKAATTSAAETNAPPNPDAVEKERLASWLNSKFEEWNAAAASREVTRSRVLRAPGD